MILEDRAKEHAKELLKNHVYYQNKAQETADDLAKKMTSVERCLSNIRIASGNIAGYMAQCEQHADRTRNVFMCAVVGCVIVVALTLWWSNNVRTNLDDDRKELKYLDGLFKGLPDFEKVDGKNYVRIVEGSETNDLKNKNGHYGQVWYSS